MPHTDEHRHYSSGCSFNVSGNKTLKIFAELCGNTLLYVFHDGALVGKYPRNSNYYARYILTASSGLWEFYSVFQGTYPVKNYEDYGFKQFSVEQMDAECYDYYCENHSSEDACNGTFEPVGGAGEDEDFE